MKQIKKEPTGVATPSVGITNQVDYTSRLEDVQGINLDRISELNKILNLSSEFEDCYNNTGSIAVTCGCLFKETRIHLKTDYFLKIFSTYKRRSFLGTSDEFYVDFNGLTFFCLVLQDVV